MESLNQGNKPVYNIAKIAETAYLLKQREVIERDSVLSKLERQLREMNVENPQGTNADDIVALMADVYPEVDRKFVLQAIEAYHPSSEKAVRDLDSIDSKPVDELVLQAYQRKVDNLVNSCLDKLRANLPSLEFDCNSRANLVNTNVRTYFINEIIEKEYQYLFGLIKGKKRTKRKLANILYDSSYGPSIITVEITLMSPMFTHACKDVLKDYKALIHSITHTYKTD